MSPRLVNVLLTSFPGLGLPSTLSLPIDETSSIRQLTQSLLSRLPQTETRLIFTTTSNKEIHPSDAAVSSLLSSDNDTFIPLRLSVPLCGGKGGFGSQLRAAGGRMSSKRKKNQGENNSSNRNLDGRRLRTVNEAKALAEYLALKPEMEKKEKEATRKRWEQVLEIAEKREEDVRKGSKAKVDGRWVEDRDEAGERARKAVLAAMESGDYHDNLKESSSGSSGGGSGQPSEDSEDDEMHDSAHEQKTGSVSKPAETSSRSYVGFDEDDEFMSDSEEEEEEVEAREEGAISGKGEAMMA